MRTKNYLIPLVFSASVMCMSQTMKAQVTDTPGYNGDNVTGKNIKKTTAGHSVLDNFRRKLARPKPGDAMDSIHTFSIFYALDVCGLNYAVGSVMTQTRISPHGSGFPATINISGMPTSCMVIDTAYLYFQAAYTESSVPTASVSITNPSGIKATYTATNIGYSEPMCYGNGTATYRLGLSGSAIPGNGPYHINITGFNNVNREVNGCTLFIIYQAGPTNATTGSLFLFDGDLTVNTYAQYHAISASTSSADMVSGIYVCNNSTDAQAFAIIAGAEDKSSNRTNVESANGTTASFTNNMWNFDLFNTSVTAGQTTTTFQPYLNDGNSSTSTLYSCYTLEMYGMYWQNTGCDDCVPSITIAQNVPCGSTTGSISASVDDSTYTPYTYTWAPSGGTNASYSGLSLGTYTITVEDGICNTTSVTVTLSQPPPLAATTSITTGNCGSSGGTATASVTGGTSPYTYSWNPSGNTNSTVSGLSAGTYTITVTDNNSCTATQSVIITPTNSPTVTVNVTANVNCFGQSTGSATAIVTGGMSAYTYSWNPSGGNAAGASSLAAGTYTINLTDANGCTASATGSITQPTTALSATASATPSSCKTNSGTATVNASGGSPGYSYSWSPGNQTNATATGLGAGTYTVNITDANTCTYSVSAVVTQPSSITATISSSANISCYGQTNGSATVSASNGITPYTYSWSPGGQTITAVTGLAAGVYSAVATDSSGCSATAIVTLTQPAKIVPVISGRDTICTGTSTTLTATGGTTYVWNPGSNTGTSITVNPTTNTPYTLTATVGSCSHDTSVTIMVVPVPTASITATKLNACSGDTLTLTGSSGTTYLWNPGNKTTDTIHVSPIDTTTYTLYSYGGTCVASTSLTIDIIPKITAIVSPGTSICPGNNTSLTITASGGTVLGYKWSNGVTTSNTSSINVNPSTTTTYTATAYGICDTVQQSVKVTVVPLPAPVISGNNLKCAGTTGTDTYTVSGATTYIWSNGSTTSSITIGSINADSTLYVVAVNSLGCPDTASFTITLKTPPTVTIPAQITCSGECTTLTAVASGSGNTFSWSNGANTDTTTVCPDTTANTYSVSVSNGCPAKQTTIVQVYPISLSACCNDTINKGESVQLTATSDSLYKWTPSTGLNCTTCPSVIATPTATTTYTVTGISSHGCSEVTLITVTVEIPCSTLTIPNVFTPNGDGINDLFVINAPNFNAYSVLIYDRWGREMYKSSDPSVYWDGDTEGGDKAADGTYFYMITASCQGKNYNLHGFVQLIR